MTDRLHFHFSLSCTGEGNGSPLQCSCLENPRDGGAWWAAVYGVAQSPHRQLKQQQHYPSHPEKSQPMQKHTTEGAVVQSSGNSKEGDGRCKPQR